MTCIVGLIHDGKVYIGGDSAGVADYSLTIRADPKVFRNGEFIFGFTSSFRMGQLLAHALRPPRRNPADDIYAFMVTDFINAVRDCLKAGGFNTRVSEADVGGDFLVGYAGRLFYVGQDYQVGESQDGLLAVGCGDQIALGALMATPDMPPEKRINNALTIAERLSAGVRGPFKIEVL